MNWAKDNPFLTGYIVVSVLVLGGLGYFAYTNYGTYAELQSTYQTEVGSLHQLQNKSPYPSQENLQKVKESVALYHDALTHLGDSLKAYQMPLDEEMSPQQFQDALRKAVSQVQADATEAGVKLPDDFYLGFDAYRAGLPSQEATPELARELKAIVAIIGGIIETKVTQISQFTRASLAVESGTTSTRIRRGNTRGPATETAVPPVQTDVLDITLNGEQARVRLAVNSLLTSPQFLIVRALKIQNSSMGSPTKGNSLPADSKDSNQNTYGEPNPQNANAPEALNMLFGRETLTAQIRAELLEFQILETANSEKSN